jgi:hypothetical protein
VIKSIEKSKRVQIYGIGIMSDSVKALYKESRVLWDSSELEEALLSFIKDKLLSN